MNNRNFVEGVRIISKHMPEEEQDSFGVHAAHDQIWFGAEEWVNEPNDIDRLKELGWFIDEKAWSLYT